MDAKELEETIVVLEGYQVNLATLFKKVLASYGAKAPNVLAVHEAQTAIAEAIGELHKVLRKPPATSQGGMAGR